MRKLYLISVLMFFCLGVCAQSMEEKVALAIKIDSLSNVLKDLMAIQANPPEQLTILQLKDSVDLFRQYEKYAEDKKKYDSSLASKNEQIDHLKSDLASLKVEYAAEEGTMLQRAADEMVAGQNASLRSIADIYVKSSFEDLVKSTSLGSVLRDKELLVSFQETLPLINDLIVYHKGEELLGRRYDETAVSESKEELVALFKYGEVVEDLWNKLDCYGIFVDIIVDSMGGPAPDGSMNEKAAREDFWDKLTSFIYSCDFNFNNYPYLSDIILELIQKKTDNPLGDVSYIIEKLK